MGVLRARETGASAARSDDVRGGVIRRPRTSPMGAGWAVKTEEHRGVANHGWNGGTEGRSACGHVRTYRVCAARTLP